jgi:hypothetical protein
MSERTIPSDFPPGGWSGAVAGAQPKVLVRRFDSRYVVGLTNDERQERYEACADLSSQLTTYALRKMTENPARSAKATLTSLEAAIIRRVGSGVWQISVAEIAWILAQVGAALKAHAPDPTTSPSAAAQPASGRLPSDQDNCER